VSERGGGGAAPAHRQIFFFGLHDRD
jgi:hypothetical protein